MVVRLCGVVGEIPPFVIHISNGGPEAGYRTMSGGQFDWGGHLLKSNGGARRLPWHGRKSCCKCKGIRQLDCESDNSSRYESRS